MPNEYCTECGCELAPNNRRKLNGELFCIKCCDYFVERRGNAKDMKKLKQALDRGKCKCTPDETTGWTTVKCCNICGLPIENEQPIPIVQQLEAQLAECREVMKELKSFICSYEYGCDICNYEDVEMKKCNKELLIRKAEVLAKGGR